jgi:hypothetical protein
VRDIAEDFAEIGKTLQFRSQGSGVRG